MYNQPEIRYSKNLHEQKEQLFRDLPAYLEYLADIQAGITLTVDRYMTIPYYYQIVSHSRRSYDDVVVEPGSYRLRALRKIVDGTMRALGFSTSIVDLCWTYIGTVF